MRPDWPVALPVTGVRLSLWRAAAAYRIVTFASAMYLIARWQGLYARPGVALAVGLGMAAVTALVCWLAVIGQAHRPSVLAADAVITAALTLGSIPAQTAHQRHGDMPTLTTLWAAGPALEAGIVFAALGGVIGGAIQFSVAMIVRDGYDGRTLASGLILVVAAGVTGYVATLVRRAEDELRVITAERASLAERERLARSIHDGVLQVLGLVSRSAPRSDEQWAEIATEARRQEAALRALVAAATTPSPEGTADLAALLRGVAQGRASLGVPADSLPMPAAAATELAAAVAAALDNVRNHAGDGAQAWVLVEHLSGEVRVTVRDDGAGITPGRLEAAAADGRLGVASSIRGRIRDLGGVVDIRSTPGSGTTVEICVPVGGSG